MKPTLDDFLTGSARWMGEHQSIRYELSWHGLSDYNSEGTWCYYLHLYEEVFYPADWAKLRLEREDKQFANSWHRHFNYDAFPDVEPHCGWTFGEMDIYLGKDGKDYEHVKVGCDYAHLWDRESGYWQGKNEVERDAKRSIDLLCEMFPRRRQRCGYSGRYGDPEDYYKARNGAMVHKDFADKFDDGWAAWRPADLVATPI